VGISVRVRTDHPEPTHTAIRLGGAHAAGPRYRNAMLSAARLLRDQRFDDVLSEIEADTWSEDGVMPARIRARDGVVSVFAEVCGGALIKLWARTLSDLDCDRIVHLPDLVDVLEAGGDLEQIPSVDEPPDLLTPPEQGWEAVGSIDPGRVDQITHDVLSKFVERRGELDAVVAGLDETDPAIQSAVDGAVDDILVDALVVPAGLFPQHDGLWVPMPTGLVFAAGWLDLVHDTALVRANGPWLEIETGTACLYACLDGDTCAIDLSSWCPE